MEKYIHEYLTENYYLYKSMDNDWIYPKNDSSDNILFDLQQIYGLETVETKLFVYTWVSKEKLNVDLSNFWEVKEGEYLRLIKPKPKWGEDNSEGLVLPLVQRVIAQTIALDLVAVVPMEAPKTNLMYLDCVYGQPIKKPKLTFKQWKSKVKVKLIEKFNSVSNKIIIFIYKRLLIPNNYNTFVTQKK